METKVIIYVIFAVFGVCATGFFFLSVWLRSLNKDIADIKLEMKDKMSFDWFEEIYKKELRKEFEGINKEVSKLTEAIMGTVEKKGMLTKVHSHEDRIIKLEEK